MTDHLTRTSAQQHVADLVSASRQARAARNLRRARRRFDKTQPQATRPGSEYGVMTTEPLTGVRWGHRLGPAPAR
jgi:HAMP domain-containing protein